MTTFPSLVPSSRTYSPGTFPHASHLTLSGLQSRVRTSNVMLASQLRLGFSALEESQMLDILTHYRSQLGSYLSFTLPDSSLSASGSPSELTLTGYRWRYLEPPVVEDLPCGHHNVEILLETVPPEGVAASGAIRRINTSFAAGTSAAANGFRRTVTASIVGACLEAVGLDAVLSAAFDHGEIALNSLGLDAVLTSSVEGGISAFNGLSASVSYSILGGTAAEKDPLFSSVALLLAMDGTNESTAFTDSSSNGLTLTVNGSAKISTVQVKHGTGSLNCNSGTNAWLSYPSASGNALDVSSGQDYTVEFWLYPTSVFATETASSKTCVFEFSGSTDHTINMFTSGGNPVVAFTQNYGVNWFAHQTALMLNQWQHVALVRSSNVIWLYLDGVQSASSYTSNAALDNASFVSIGPRQSGSSNKIYIDGFRLTVGTARYTSAFTPSTGPWPIS